MNQFQVLNYSVSGPPDFRRHLGSPMVMTCERFAVARQVKCRAALPAAVKNSGNAAAVVSRPSLKRKDRVGFEVPRPSRGRSIRIPRALETQVVLEAIARGHRDLHEGPSNTVQAPPVLQFAKPKIRLGDISSKHSLVRRAHVMVSKLL